MFSRAPEKQADHEAFIGFDERAFERAFDLASSEVHQAESLSHSKEGPVEQAMSPDIDRTAASIRIGSDRIIDDTREKGPDSIVSNDADELARTAGKLLENVKDDRSQKFQKSSFLSLMRQLRDREVRVEGDKLVDVSIPLSAAP